MLWIISGSVRSGKNTLRNILARDYGFQVINKYVDAETAGKTFQYIDDSSSMAVKCATRDPFLVTGNKEANHMIDQLKKKEIKKDDVSKQYFIYEKTNEKYYLIRVEDIREAILDDDRNYVLVCSEPETVQNIKNVEVPSVNSFGTLDDAEKWQRIKTVLIFGMHIKATEKKKDKVDQALSDATNKFSEYLKGMMNYNDLFDFVIYNKYSKRETEFLQDEWDKMYIKLAQTWDSKGYHPFCYKLTSNNEKKIYNSGVFFIKPFINSDSSIRPQIVLNAVNKEIKSIAGTLKISLREDDKPVQEYDMTGAMPVEYVRGNEDPWGQMRAQIEAANLIIADVADINDNQQVGHKPNCYWELGYARALRKNIIVLVDDAAGKVAFDEQDKVYIKYRLNKKTVTDDKQDQGSDNYDFEEKGVMRMDLGRDDALKVSNEDGYSFNSQIKKFYSRLEQAIKVSSMNVLILKAAAKAESDNGDGQ